MIKLFSAVALAISFVAFGSPCAVASEIPSEFKTVEITPVQGDCPGLSVITLSFSDYADVDITNPSDVILYKGDTQVTVLTKANVDNAYNDMEEVVAIKFNPEIKDAGSYRLVIKPGALTIIEKGTFASFSNTQALTLEYNIVGAVAYDLNPEWIKPAEGTIDLSMVQFESVILGVGPDIRPLADAKATLSSADGSYNETVQLKFNFGNATAAQLIAFFRTPTYNGDYTLTIPQGSFGTPIWLTNQGIGNANPEITVKYKVAGGRNNNNVVYDITPSSVTPTPGRSVKELKEITLTFDEDVNLTLGAQATLAIGFGRYFASVPIQKVDSKTYSVTFNPMPTEEGDYTLTINEGTFYDNTNAENPYEGRMNAELTYSWSMSSLIDVTSTVPADDDILLSLPTGYQIVINTNNNAMVASMDIGISEIENGKSDERMIASGESSSKNSAGAIYWENQGENILLYKEHTYYINYTLYNSLEEAIKTGTIVIAGDSDSTGVDAILRDSSDEIIFNLQGIRVNTDKTELPSGMYIINGKKVIIR